MNKEGKAYMNSVPLMDFVMKNGKLMYGLESAIWNEFRSEETM